MRSHAALVLLALLALSPAAQADTVRIAPPIKRWHSATQYHHSSLDGIVWFELTFDPIRSCRLKIAPEH